MSYRQHIELQIRQLGYSGRVELPHHFQTQARVLDEEVLQAAMLKCKQKGVWMRAGDVHEVEPTLDTQTITANQNAKC